MKNVLEFIEVEKQFFEKKQSSTLEEARILKKELKKKASKKDASPEDKADAQKAVKLYAFLLRRKHEKEGANLIRSQEELFQVCKRGLQWYLGRGEGATRLQQGGC